MQSGGGAIVRVTRRLGVLCVCSVLLALAGTMIAYAVDTQIQASVNSGATNPSLALTSVSSPVTAETMPLNLAGTARSLTQIQVYVNDVFSVTIPLDEGATTFSHALVMPSGANTVKLVGISPFVDITPTVTIAVTYDPPMVASGSEFTASSGVTIGSEQGGGGAVISRDGSGVSTGYVDPPAATTLPSWLYTGLLALDIARPGDTDGEIIKMAQRVAVLAPAFFLVVFARPTLYAYRFVRYQWLGLREHPFPKSIRRHPLSHIRIVGLILIFSVFSFS